MPSDRALNLAAGPLRKRVTVRRYSESTDSFGQVNKSWSDVATVWARVEPLNSREIVVYQQLQARNPRAVVTRHLAAADGGPVTERDRLSLDGADHEVVNVVDVLEQHKLLRVLVVSLPAGS